MWSWNSGSGEMYIQSSQQILFAVVAEHFADQPPPAPLAPAAGQPGAPAGATGTASAGGAAVAGQTGALQADILADASSIPYYLLVSLVRLTDPSIYFNNQTS